ncbi:MAG: alpha/beta fold hydrolase [Pedobacter sp.]|nr:alpha/beta fold hydrolase [Pedobacter sp.]
MRDALVGRIYDTLLKPSDWMELLETLSAWTPAGDTAAGESPQQELEGLIGHMERAAEGSAYMHRLEDQNHLLTRIYHSMPWPMLMLADDMSVVSCNTAAQQALVADSPLQLQANGTLVFRDATLKQKLRHVISMAGGRQTQLLSASTEPLTLLCMPFEKSDAEGSIARVRVVVWVLASQHVVVPSPESLQSTFKLSQAEGRLLHLLCKIGNLNQCADLLSVSIHTARTQLKSVMAKVEVNSQVQLVSQAMNLSLLQSSTELQCAGAQERTMTLADGRVLSWYEYGPARGRPVLMLENIGSSIPDHSRFEDWYQEQGLRVIVVVRPGYGLSTARPDFQFRDFGADLKALCKHLHIERPVMAAYCCGGAYALCTAALHPDFFERVGVLGSTVPIEHFELDKLDRIHRMFLQVFQRDPRLFVLIGKLALRGSRQAPEKFFLYLAKGLTKRDKSLLTDPDILQSIIRQQKLRHFQGARILIDEYINLQHSWQTDLAQIRIPTLLWHGEDDAIISIGSARSLAASIPVARFRAIPGQGRFLVFDMWKEFLSELLELPADKARLNTQASAS